MSRIFNTRRSLTLSTAKNITPVTWLLILGSITSPAGKPVIVQIIIFVAAGVLGAYLLALWQRRATRRAWEDWFASRPQPTKPMEELEIEFTVQAKKSPDRVTITDKIFRARNDAA